MTKHAVDRFYRKSTPQGPRTVVHFKDGGYGCYKPKQIPPKVREVLRLYLDLP